MNWKSRMAIVAFSLIVSCPMEGARVERSIRSPQMVSDTSSMLQEMNGQMRLMQEQLSNLKASQQLLSAESAIKSLTPKVRKMEVHLERLEKHLQGTVDAAEVDNVKNELQDLKDKFKAFISKPDSTLDEAINAISPTLDRVQKQVFYLYEAYKKQGADQKQFINKKFEDIHAKLSVFESEIDKKTSDILGLNGSLNIMRQNMQVHHDAIGKIKHDFEVVRNEKIAAIENDLNLIKNSQKQDLVTAQIAEVQDKMNKLAQVMKKSLVSLQEAAEKTQQNLKRSDEYDAKLKAMGLHAEKTRNGLKIVYRKARDVLEEMKVVKNHMQILEAGFQKIGVAPLAGSEHKTMELYKKGLIVLKLRSDKLIQQLSEVKTQIQPIQNHLQKLTKQTHELYKRSKLSASRDDLKAVDLRVNKLFEQTKALYLKSKELSSRQMVGQLIEKEDLMPIHERLNDHKTHLETLNNQILKLQESLKSSVNSDSGLSEESKKKIAANFENHHKKLNQLYMRTRELVELQKKTQTTMDQKFARLSQLTKAVYAKTKAAIEKAQINGDPKEIQILEKKLVDNEKTLKTLETKLNAVGSELVSLKKTAQTQTTVEPKDGSRLKKAVALLYVKLQSVAEQQKSILASVEKMLSSSEEKLASITQQAHELHAQTEAQNVSLSENTRKISEMDATSKSRFAKIAQQTQFLYKKTKDVAKLSDIEALKSSITEMQKAPEASLAIVGEVKGLQAQLQDIQLKLNEKDQAIAQLKRKVAFLTKTLHESLSKEDPSEDLNQFKAQIEEKVNKQLSSLQTDKMMFEALLQRIAALEGSLSMEDEPLHNEID